MTADCRTMVNELIQRLLQQQQKTNQPPKQKNKTWTDGHIIGRR